MTFIEPAENFDAIALEAVAGLSHQKRRRGIIATKRGER
jgi:hypothetical protein